VTAELTGNGGEACAVLTVGQRGTVGGRTCEERWRERSAEMLSEPGVRESLRRDSRAIPSARVVVSGDSATIAVPTPLLGGSDELVWTESCWMLKG
jgi:hypothetical protein